MYQQGSEIAVAPFADTQQVLFTATGVLAGHQAQPGSDLPAVVKVLGIANGGHQGTGRDGADSGNTSDFAAELAAAMPGNNLQTQSIDLGIELFEVVQQTLHKKAKCAWQLARTIFNEFGNAFGNVSDTLRDDQTKLCQQTPNLIGLGGSGFDKALPNGVQCQDALLLDVLDRHKAHVGSGHCFADCLSIGGIVLVGLDVGFDELGSHQFDGVTQVLELACPVVGAAAGLHTDQARGQVDQKLSHLIALELLFKDCLAMFVDAMQLEHVFCQIDA